jgi:hypothetical protein
MLLNTTNKLDEAIKEVIYTTYEDSEKD